MRLLFGLAAGLLIAGSLVCAAASNAGEVMLIVPDEPAYIPKANGLFDPALTQTNAADRLGMLIERAVGVRPRIVPAAQTPTSGLRIFVGYGPHLKGKVTPPTQPEGLRIQEREGSLYLLGEIAPKGVNNCPGPMDRGLMHAVETYAERVLGYRFLFSTPNDDKMFELGTVIPKLDKITNPPGLLIEEAPVFQHRVTNSRMKNLMGLRSGSAPAFTCNHSYGMQWWSAAYGKKHPELFVSKRRSKDEDGAAAVMASERNLTFLDYTEPLVLQKRLEQIQLYLDEGIPGGFNYKPTIKYLVEEPPDSVPPSADYNERARALLNPRSHAWGKFSNIWFDYLARLSPEVKRRWPQMRISTLAYMRHYDVPSFNLPDNIDVMLALMRSSMGNKEPAVFQRNLEDVKRWSKHLGGDHDRLFLWEYGCWPAFWVSTPVICPHAMQQWLKEVRPYVSGVFFEMYEPDEYYYLMRRLWMRLLWNPDLNVEAEIADVCRQFYGPAGETMTAFYNRLIARYEMPWKSPKLQHGQYYVDEKLYFVQSYPPAEIERLGALLAKAAREVGLPQAVATELWSGSAVHISNAGDARAPISISVTALADELVNPVVVWGAGRLSWPGRLKPGERLDVSESGAAKVTTRDGQRRDAAVKFEGKLPALAARKSDVFLFRQSGRKPGAKFRVEVRCGPGSKRAAADAEQSIYARRLLWLSDAYRVLRPPPKGKSTRGFFADAHAAHQRMGLAPSFEKAPMGQPRKAGEP